MTLATAQGRAFALQALADRRAASKQREPFFNERLPAGSPVFLECIACGTLIPHPENYLTRSDLCAECDALRTLAWLE